MTDEKDITFPIFSYEAMPDDVATKKNGGIPVFQQIEMVTIKTPGSRDEVYRPVEKRDRERWAAMYQRWKDGMDQKMDGIPISEFATATESERATLRACGVHTVEQAAGMNDDAAQKFHIIGLRNKAQAFIKTREGLSQVGALEARIKELERELKRMNDGNVGATVSKGDEGDGVQPPEHVPDQPDSGRKAAGGVGKRGRQRTGHAPQVA